MLKEFSKDLAEDREFEFGGETFTFRYPSAEEMVDYLDKAVADGAQATNGQLETTFTKDLSDLIENTLLYIDGGPVAHERFKALTATQPRFAFLAVHTWLVETTSGYPTQPPSDSSTGAETSPPSSSGKSRSRVVTPAK